MENEVGAVLFQVVKLALEVIEKFLVVEADFCIAGIDVDRKIECLEVGLGYTVKGRFFGVIHETCSFDEAFSGEAEWGLLGGVFGKEFLFA